MNEDDDMPNGKFDIGEIRENIKDLNCENNTVVLTNTMWENVISKLTLNEFKVFMAFISRYQYLNSDEPFEMTRAELNILISKKLSIKDLEDILHSIKDKIGILKEVEFEDICKTVLIGIESMDNIEGDFTKLDFYTVSQVRTKLDLIVYFYLKRYSDCKDIYIYPTSLSNSFGIKTSFNRTNKMIRDILKGYANSYKLTSISPIYKGKKIVAIKISKK